MFFQINVIFKDGLPTKLCMTHHLFCEVPRWCVVPNESGFVGRLRDIQDQQAVGKERGEHTAHQQTGMINALQLTKNRETTPPNLNQGGEAHPWLGQNLQNRSRNKKGARRAPAHPNGALAALCGCGTQWASYAVRLDLQGRGREEGSLQRGKENMACCILIDPIGMRCVD